MQVVEKPCEGLSRSYGVMVPATELGAALDARIAELLPTLNLNGFRPGKVPQAHVRRLYGKALMGEVIEKTINETSQRVLADHHLRIASRPDLKPVSDMDRVILGGEDLAYDLEVEVMPEFEPVDVTTLSLTRLVHRPAAEEIDTAMASVVSENRTYEAYVDEAQKAGSGDQLVVDFIGRIDGEAFEGGAAEDVELVLGADRFIPGFEAQLVGAKSGEDVTVTVTFPDAYDAKHLAGKTAEFDVKVKAVRAPKEAALDDALAQRLGLADLPALTDAIRQTVEKPYQEAARFKLKRALLDALDERHDIPLPPRMVEAEFAGIWAQVEKDKGAGEDSPEDAGKSEEELRAEYRKIAERRVRLGLVLAEIGRRDNVVVTEAELGDAMRAEAMKYGAQAREIFDFMRQNAELQAQMRAPLYEEKIVDLVLGRATVEEREVSKAELMKDDDLPDGYGHEQHDHDHDRDHDHDHAGAHDHGGDGEPVAPIAAKPARKAKLAKVAKDEIAAAPAGEAAPAAKSPAKPRTSRAKAAKAQDA